MENIVEVQVSSIHEGSVVAGYAYTEFNRYDDASTTKRNLDGVARIVSDQYGGRVVFDTELARFPTVALLIERYPVLNGPIDEAEVVW